MFYMVTAIDTDGKCMFASLVMNHRLSLPEEANTSLI